MSGDRRTREHDDSCNCVGCQVSRPYIRDGEQPAAPTRRSSLSRVRANAAYVAARASRDAWVGDKDLPALDADPDTPTACETCGDAGWFTADPSDPEFCECEAGKRLMAANNADPDTPTADAPAEAAVKVYIDTRDWWVGYYRGPNHHYVCPIPCVVIRWSRWIARGETRQP